MTKKLSITELKKRVRKLGKGKIPLINELYREELESFLSKAPWSLGWRFKYIQSQTKKKIDARHAIGQTLGPVRDLTKYPKVKRFLRRHSVSTTMTSSPLRLSKLSAVLATLDVKNLSNIYIVLPHTFGSKKKKYKKKDIDKIKKFSPLVKVIRTKKDYGPITKMLPVIRRIKDNKSIIISIDDDVGLSFGNGK